MNFLELAKRLVQEAGISGGGPATVQGQVGQLARVIGWVSAAWTDIQLERHDWKFMRETDKFSTAQGRSRYTKVDFVATGISDWTVNGYVDRSFYIYEPSRGEGSKQPLSFIDIDEYEDLPYTNAEGSRGQPRYVTMAEDGALRLFPTPDKPYFVKFKYLRSAQELVNETDKPLGLPENYHMAIVWRALEMYASFEDAPELSDSAIANFATKARQMADRYAPRLEGNIHGSLLG